MNIMGQNDSPPGIQFGAKLLKTAGYQVRVVILVILRVDAGSDNMIPKIGHSRKHLAVEPGWFGHKRNTKEVSQNLITVARSTGIRTVQQLVQVSNLHATGVDPLEPGSFLRDQCDGFSTHLLCPNISVRSGLVMRFFFRKENV